jgi:hypothetical protein
MRGYQVSDTVGQGFGLAGTGAGLD